jgi:hypothetical protein
MTRSVRRKQPESVDLGDAMQSTMYVAVCCLVRQFEAQIVLNNIFDVVVAALDGFGLAYLPEDLAALHPER